MTAAEAQKRAELFMQTCDFFAGKPPREAVRFFKAGHSLDELKTFVATLEGSRAALAATTAAPVAVDTGIHRLGAADDGVPAGVQLTQALHRRHGRGS